VSQSLITTIAKSGLKRLPKEEVNDTDGIFGSGVGQVAGAQDGVEGSEEGSGKTAVVEREGFVLTPHPAPFRKHPPLSIVSNAS